MELLANRDLSDSELDDFSDEDFGLLNEPIIEVTYAMELIEA